MGLLCPICREPLITQDEDTARCVNDHGPYRILPAASPTDSPQVEPMSPAGRPQAEAVPPANTTPPEPAPPEDAACRQHPDQPAVAFCVWCGTPLCRGCAVVKGANVVCATCAALQAAVPSPASPPAPSAPPGQAPAPTFAGLLAPLGSKCVGHPEMPAYFECSQCRAPLCDVCDFAFVGGVHLCPSCVCKPKQGMGKDRRLLLTLAYSCNIWATLATICTFAGLIAMLFKGKDNLNTLGVIVMVFVWLPLLLGLIMSVSAFERNLRNPASVWGALIWSVVLLGLWMITIIF